MSGTRAKDDGYVRQDMPGGWPDDETNGFEASGRSEVQNEAWNFLRRLLKWRKGNEVIARGKMKHFKPNRGVYVYERRLGDKSVLIFLNGNHQKVNLPLDRYAEVIQGKSSGKDILTGRRIVLKKRLTLAPKGIRVMEL